MHYKTKKVQIKKNGTVSVTVAESNIRPIKFYTVDYRGTLAELLLDIQDGNFRLYKGANNAIERTVETIQKIAELLENQGLTWELEYRYGLPDRKDILSFACERYAERILADDYTDPEGFGEELGKKIGKMLVAGLNNIDKAKLKDIEEGVIRIQTAARSIFEDMDLLYPIDGTGFILAPEKDYNNAGVLKTDPKNVVHLGKESNGLYAFLSFTGVNMSYNELKQRAGDDNIFDQRMANVFKVCERALNAGARFKNGIRPFIGYSDMKEGSRMMNVVWTNESVLRLLESIRQDLNDKTYHTCLEDLEQKIDDEFDLTISAVEEDPAYCIEELAKGVTA